MKRILMVLALLILLTAACQFSGSEAEPSEAPPALSEGRCGDQVCDGPENNKNCPADCAAGMGPNNKPADEQDAPAAEAAQDKETHSTEDGYRYVSLGGEIITSMNTASMGDFTGIILSYAGEYKIELWFPISGGEAVQQRNTITLTDYKDEYIGDSQCMPCTWDLDAAAYQPQSFELKASLNLDVYEEDGQPADELLYQMTQLPNAIVSGSATCSCPGAATGPFSDPAVFPVLTTWFTQAISNPIQLNVIESNSVDHFAITPMNFVDIPQETLSYLIVPDLDTP